MDASTVPHNTLFRNSLLCGVLALSSIAALGCSSDATDPGSLPTSKLYTALHWDWSAINIALTPPYDTVQLVATPVDADGAPITTDSVVRYKALDSTVTVSATGLLTAHYLTDQSPIIASLTLNGITHTDTAQVRVTAMPLESRLETFTMQPTVDGLDSAKISYSNYHRVNQFNGTIPVIAVLANGDSVCHVYDIGCQILVNFKSSNPNVATLDPTYGYLEAEMPGRVTFYASTYAYGVGKRDSLPFVIGYSIVWYFTADQGGSPDHPIPYYTQNVVDLGVGGFVGISNAMQDDVVVTFPYHTPMVYNLYDDPPYSSQMTDTFPPNPDSTVYVEFDSAGTYTFSTTVLGHGGASTKTTINVSSGP